MRSPTATILAWTTLALIALLALGGAAARPTGILLAVPGAGAVAAVAVGLFGLWLLGERKASPAAALGLIFVPPLLVFWPGAPGMRALSGPPLLVPALAAAVLMLRREPPRWLRRAFLPTVLLVYSVAAARVQTQVGAEGDEPHYLMVAESLLRDRDLALDDDYAEARYRAFYRTHAELAPHFRVRGRDGQIYSLHAVGLSVLILPAYALWGYAGASFFMVLLAALLAREIRELVRGSGASEGLAQGVAWVVALSPPLVHYAGLIFTEIPAALGVAIVLRRAREPPGWRMGLLAGLVVAGLPWLNVRYAALALILLAYALAVRPRRSVAAALAVPALLSAAGIALYHFVLYGFLDPRRVYGTRREFSTAILPEGLPGLLLDQEFGLLVYAPVFALAVPGMLELWRVARRPALTALALVAVVLLTAGAWPMWRGGFNPPGRFLVPLLPVLALALTARWRRGLGAAGALLVAWSVFTGLAGASEPRLVHRDRDGTAPLFRERSGAEEWTRLLPGYVLAEHDRRRLAVVWAVALAMAAAHWRRPASPAVGLSLATLGMMSAAGVASLVSDGRSYGRDAVRVLGRPALEAPPGAWQDSAAAEWRWQDLGWGPLYEPHRYPGGAELGRRLPLGTGGYRLFLDVEELSPDTPPPELEVGLAERLRRVACERRMGGLAAEFTVERGERAVSLRLYGGGAFLLRRLRLTLLAPVQQAEGRAPEGKAGPGDP